MTTVGSGCLADVDAVRVSCALMTCGTFQALGSSIRPSVECQLAKNAESLYRKIFQPIKSLNSYKMFDLELFLIEKIVREFFLSQIKKYFMVINQA